MYKPAYSVTVFDPTHVRRAGLNAAEAKFSQIGMPFSEGYERWPMGRSAVTLDLNN